MRNNWIVELGVVAVAFAGVTFAACTLPSPIHGDTSGAGASPGTGNVGVASGFAGSSPVTGIGGDGDLTPTGIAGATGAGGTAACPSGAAGASRPVSSIPLQLPSGITQAATPVPPLSGGTLLVLADGKTAVAADPERDRVSIVDLTAGTVRATATLQAGDEPGRAVEDAAGRVHVVLRRGGAIATIDPATGTVSARQAVCSAPRGLAYQTATNQLHVACAGGELVSLSLDNGGAPARTLTLDRDLRDVVVGAGGSLLVSTFRKSDVLVVDATGTITGRLQLGSGVVPSFATGMPQMRTPSVAWRMVALGAETGDVVVLHQTGVTDVVDPSAGGYAGVKGCGGIVQPSVSVLRQTQTAPSNVAGGINMVSLAVDVAVSPDGQKVALAVPGNAHTPGTPTIVEEPMSVVSQPGTSCNFGSSPSNPPTGEVIAVSYAGDGTLIAQTREPAGLWRSDVGTTISFGGDSRFDTGHLIFHANAGGGLACASCHPEGGEDGRVWTFACQGARRTQSIRGGISATAPFHWDGGESDISRLMDDVFTGRMAGPTLSTDQKKALQGWIDTIPALPKRTTTTGLDSAALARGQALFTDATIGCAACHAGTLMTNNTTVDVGTGGAFQVPSLRGVGWRAPFMHSGCAATLADRFGTAACGGDKHGATATLTTAQIGDLTTYLESL